MDRKIVLCYTKYATQVYIFSDERMYFYIPVKMHAILCILSLQNLLESHQ